MQKLKGGEGNKRFRRGKMEAKEMDIERVRH